MRFFLLFFKARKKQKKQVNRAVPDLDLLGWTIKMTSRPLIPSYLSGRGREGKRGQVLLGCFGSEKGEKKQIRKVHARPGEEVASASFEVKKGQERSNRDGRKNKTRKRDKMIIEKKS